MTQNLSTSLPGAVSVAGMVPEAFGAERFLNRELSWLDFGSRLLDLAEQEDIPLLERVEVPGDLLLRPR